MRAELRPDDHPQPYNITRWELGNENYHTNQRYWMSQNEDDALEQYITGGSRRILDQRLGKLSVPDAQGRLCGGSTAPIPSDGTKTQMFDLNYPTVEVDDFKLRVDGELWRRADNMTGVGPTAKQYVLNQFRGTVTFGDGTNGVIPPRGVNVVASYTSIHKGYVDYRAAMRTVDPDIEVCAAWGRTAFATTFEALKGGRIPPDSRYDCLATHPYTHFTGGGMADWDSRVEAHDWHMLGARDARQKFLDIRTAVGRNAQNAPYVAISESGPLRYPFQGAARGREGLLIRRRRTVLLGASAISPVSNLRLD